MKICGESRTERGEQVREYFRMCEEELNKIYSQSKNMPPENKIYPDLPTEITGDFIIAIGQQMNKLQQKLTLAEKYIDDTADIVAGVEATSDEDTLSFRLRDFVKLTGTSKIPVKLTEMAFRQQLIDDQLIYFQYNNKNGLDYYPKAHASKWFTNKISRRKQGKHWVKDVVLRITELGACYLLCRYCGVDKKTAQQVVGTALDNPIPAATPVPIRQTSTTTTRSPLEPSQFVENGVVRPIEEKSTCVA